MRCQGCVGLLQCTHVAQAHKRVVVHTKLMLQGASDGVTDEYMCVRAGNAVQSGSQAVMQSGSDAVRQ